MGDQASQGRLSPWLQRARLAAAQPHLSGDVLDIGCGNGALADLVEPARYQGMDRDEASLAKARALHPEHSFSNALPEGRRFDTVVALALIEHLPDPAGAVREWAGYLKAGGRLVMTTPHKSFHWVHDAGGAIGLFSHEAADEHEVMFDRAGLADLAAAAELELLEYRRFLFGANQFCIMAKADNERRSQA